MKTKITVMPDGKVYINPMTGGLSDPSCTATLSFIEDLPHCMTGSCNGVEVISSYNSGNPDECIEINGELYKPFSGTFGDQTPSYLKCSSPDGCYDGCIVNFAFQTYTIPDSLTIKGSPIVIPTDYSADSGSGSGSTGQSAPVFDDVIYAISTPWQCDSGSGSSSGNFVDGLSWCDCGSLAVPDDVTGSNYTSGCEPYPCKISGSFYSTGPISTYDGYFIGQTVCYGCPIEAIVDAPLGGTAWNLFIEGCGLSTAVQGGGQGYFTWTGSQYDQSYYCNQGGGSGPSVPISHPIPLKYVDPLNYAKTLNKSK